LPTGGVLPAAGIGQQRDRLVIGFAKPARLPARSPVGAQIEKIDEDLVASH
jgi:hypothetical protein